MLYSCVCWLPRHPCTVHELALNQIRGESLQTACQTFTVIIIRPKKVSHFASQITKIADACLKLTQSNFFRHHALAPRICRHGYAVPFGNADQADRLPGCLYMCAVSYGAAPLAAGVGPIILIRTDGHEVWPQFLTCVSTFVYVSSSPATAAWHSTLTCRNAFQRVNTEM